MDLSILKSYRNSNGYPPSVCIELIKRCNLMCPYCRSGSSPKESDSLDFITVSDLLTRLAKLCKWRVSLTGGEPLLYPFLEGVIEEIACNNLPFCITTNGTQPVSKLKAMPDKIWANATLKVSIDGNQNVHDKYRGKGNFLRTVNFIKESRKFIPRLIVNSVMIQDGSDWAEEIFETLRQLKVDRWTVISPIKSGSWPRKGFGSTVEESYIKQYDFFRKLSQDKHGYLPVSFLDYATISITSQNITFIRSDGEIFLPGYFDSKIPRATTINYKSSDVVSAIVNSSTSFIKANHHIQ